MDCNFLLPELNSLYIARFNDDFLNYFVQNGKIAVSANTNFSKFNYHSAVFTQKKVSDARGSYYQKEFQITVPDINEETAYRLNGRNLAIIFDDNNGNRFITGHEKAYTVDKMDATLSDRNQIEFSLVQNSYDRIQPLQFSGATTIEGVYVDTTNSPYLDVASPEWNALANSQLTISFNGMFSDVESNELILYKTNQYRFRKSNAKIHFELSPDNGITYQTVSTEIPILPNSWYLIQAWVSAPTMWIFVRNFDTGEGDVQALTGMSGYSDIESPYKFSINTANPVRTVGIWSRNIVADLPIFDVYGPVYYADLPSDLLPRLMAYYDFDVPNVDIIEDKHIHNIDLTLQTDDE